MTFKCNGVECLKDMKGSDVLFPHLPPVEIVIVITIIAIQAFNDQDQVLASALKGAIALSLERHATCGPKLWFYMLP